MAKKQRKTVTQGVVGYVRVSTEEQAQSGLGLDAQRKAIRAECKRREVPLLAVYEDAGMSAKNLSRPALSEALEALSEYRGTVLMVAKLDRLTRSVHDATGLMMRADKEGWGLVALDVAVDTTTPAGAAMAQVMSVFAELERKLIGQRTKDALAVKKAQGVKLGRPATLPAEVVDRILIDRSTGAGWSAIARGLNADEVPTAQGGKKWYPATVKYIYEANNPKSSRT